MFLLFRPHLPIRSLYCFGLTLYQQPSSWGVDLVRRIEPLLCHGFHNISQGADFVQSRDLRFHILPSLRCMLSSFIFLASLLGHNVGMPNSGLGCFSVRKNQCLECGPVSLKSTKLKWQCRKKYTRLEIPTGRRTIKHFQKRNPSCYVSLEVRRQFVP